MTRTVLLALAVVLVAVGSCRRRVMEPEPAVASVVVTPAELTLPDIGATGQLSAAARDATGRVLGDRTFEWSSADTTVVVVSTSGSVRGAGFGTATIHATSGGVSGSARVIVERSVASVQVIPESITLVVSGMAQLSARARDSQGTEIAGKSFTWQSRDATIARVDSMGRVTAVGAGTTTVQATTDGRVGQAHVMVSALPANATLLACGDLLSASILLAAEVDLFAFLASAGDLKLISLANTSGLVVDAVVLDPSGTRVDGLRANGVRRFTVPAAGLYIIRVNTATLTSMATYNIGLECIDPLGPVGSTLQAGDLTSGAITAAGEVEMYAFTGARGDDVLLPFATTGGLVTDATLIGPTRAQLAVFRASTIQRLTLPDSGGYVLYIHSATVTNPGSFNIGLERLRPLGPVQGALARGTVHVDSLRAAGEVDLFTLTGQAGSRVLLTLANTSGIVVMANVVAPSGAVIASLRANAARDVDLPESGTYIIYVFSATLTGLAAYNVGVQ